MAKRIEKEFVAVLIDVDVDQATAKLFGVSAMPTLVITDAEGATLAKSIGAPFSEPEAAITWFDEIGGKISTFGDLRAKWDESKHSNTEIGNQLLELAIEIGQVRAAAQVYFAQAELAGEDKAGAAELRLKALNLLLENYDSEGAGEYAEKADKLTPAEGDARIDLDVIRARVLLSSEKPDEARKLAESHYEKLIEKADARAIDFADVLVNTEGQDDVPAMMKKGRAMYVKLAQVFAKHERVWELKVYAAWYGLSGEEREACKMELAEVAEKGEGQWKDIAQNVLDRDAAEEKAKEEEGGNG